MCRFGCARLTQSDARSDDHVDTAIEYTCCWYTGHHEHFKSSLEGHYLPIRYLRPPPRHGDVMSVERVGTCKSPIHICLLFSDVSTVPARLPQARLPMSLVARGAGIGQPGSQHVEGVLADIRTEKMMPKDVYGELPGVIENMSKQFEIYTA